MEKLNLLELLNKVDPSQLNYQEWLNVGMALHHEGYSVSDFDNWSARDSERYNEGEAFKKWKSFGDSSSVVTGGTIFQYATDHGWTPSGMQGGGKPLTWDSVIDDSYNFIDTNWVEGEKFEQPSDEEFDKKRQVQEVRKYLNTLFNKDEYVSFVFDSYEKDGRFIPASGGAKGRTAGELLAELDNYERKEMYGLDWVFGKPNEKAGAWIRFNPIDGQGVKDENVTDFRYALVESDDIDLDKQYAIIKELELPVAVLMYSGGKSLHAIVKIEARSYEEYKHRVDHLYKVCSDNGLSIDTQNRNPSRLSRIPGVKRGENKQFIIDTHIGKKDWDEWEEWIELINDDLPDIEQLTDIWDDMPKLAPELIEGVLRIGHKMLIAGPSKAGKSFLLIMLTICIAEGLEWLGFKCSKGKVLYINLELDRASALHRIKAVYDALGIPPRNINNIEIWNLRGNTVPMDKLVPKLVRRAKKEGYIAVIIDPIYKVLTGDENSASEMAYFTNQFDKIALELNSSVIYCHHHSKGGQGGKRAIDRSSGSGVFARDPDAVLDLVELEVTETVLDAVENDVKAKYFTKALKKYNKEYFEENVSIDDEFSAVTMRNHIGNALEIDIRNVVDNDADELVEQAKKRSAWRLEGTLREFASFEPVNMWFEYPMHVIDKQGGMVELDVDGEQAPWEKASKKRKKQAAKKRDKNELKFFNAIAILSFKGEVNLENLSEELGIQPRTTRTWIKRYGFMIDKNDGTVVEDPTFIKETKEE